jgi:hypothetical protein
MLEVLQKRLEEAGESVERSFDPGNSEPVLRQPPKQVEKQSSKQATASGKKSLISTQSQASLVSRKPTRARSIEQMLDDGDSTRLDASSAGGSISGSSGRYSIEPLNEDPDYDSPIFQSAGTSDFDRRLQIQGVRTLADGTSTAPGGEGLFDNPASLRRAILVKEILDKPKALRK